ncbi:MAG: hypothetical protein LBL83_05760 [Clostridiales bacterium]|jgi:hypothetical protein|nr:hypothetical protein [Clostridiales bacterium]
MIVSGRIVKGRKTLFSRRAEDGRGGGAGFRDKLESCLLRLCGDADISVPVWLSKNTAELARFGKTSFFAEQFVERVEFDRFEIRIDEP